MFPPTQRKSFIDNKKKFYKPSIEQSINGFVEEVSQEEAIRLKIQEMDIKNEKVGITAYPKIFKIENVRDENGKYIVTYKECYYKFKSIVKAVDCCFKMYFVFNIDYAFQAARFWKFVAHFFYEFDVDDVFVKSVISTFNKYLKTTYLMCSYY